MADLNKLLASAMMYYMSRKEYSNEIDESIEYAMRPDNVENHQADVAEFLDAYLDEYVRRESKAYLASLKGTIEAPDAS